MNERNPHSEEPDNLLPADPEDLKDLDTMQFPPMIGKDYELWKEYLRVHGPEAYKQRRLYEATAEEVIFLREYAADHGMILPDQGNFS